MRTLKGLPSPDLLAIPVCQVETVFGQELSPSVDMAAPRRPGDDRDLRLGARFEDRGSGQRQLMETDPVLLVRRVGLASGSEMVTQNGRHGID